MIEAGMRIGELAQRTGASVRSLRYYEEQGLIAADRTPSAQRVYADDAIERVRLVRRLLGAGLNSATIAALLPCIDEPSAAATAESIDLMRAEHERIGQQIDELIATRNDLAYVIHSAEVCHRVQSAAVA